MEAKKKLPIGIEFFSDIRTKGFYYVDETYLPHGEVSIFLHVRVVLERV